MKDLTKLSIEELIGSFMTHELNMIQKKEEEESKKKKTITFNSDARLEESDESEDEDKEKSKEKDDDLVLLTTKFKKFLKKKWMKKHYKK